MATYLFTWNPKRWDWKNLNNQILQLQNNEEVFNDWGTGSRKHNIGINDQFILVRVGVQPKGIIAIGSIESELFERNHWDKNLTKQGKKTSFVKLKFNNLSPATFIKEEELQKRFPKINWTPQTNGIKIDEAIAAEIFKELNTNLKLSHQDINAQLENEILQDPKLTETDKQQLVLSRIGQGQFRNLLIKYWNHCCVTDLPLINILIASHIKPWKVADNMERLDPYNGLLLTPNLDKLFDKGHISFDKNGKIMVSKVISEHMNALSISKEMRICLTPNHEKYMEYHRTQIFNGE
ncbi:HNH endonuclease [Acinetobacter silvestris]|nr:HNH endonuclease [Acinetobacter silvestris]